MRIPRPVVGAAVVLTASAILIGPASAHVSIPDPGEQGGFSIVTLSVPNERDDASTVSIEVQLPQDQLLPFVSVQPKPGWEVETTTRTLDEPVETEFGEITEVVDTVTWSGGAIDAGQFDTFALSVGPLPDDVDVLGFPTIQTYSDGEEVAWIEPIPESGEEPEHPMPTLALVASSGDDHGGATTDDESTDEAAAAADTEDEDDGNGLAIFALVVGVVAALIAVGALITGRRQST